MPVPAGAFWCSCRGRSSLMRRGVVTPPYGCITGGAQQRADVPKAWLPPAKFRNGIWGVSHGHRPLRPAGGRGTARRVVLPYGWLRRAAAIVLGSGTQRSVCASGRKGWVEIGAEITPKVPINAGQSLSHGEAVTAPFAQRSLRDGGYGLPRRFAPRNDSPDPLSFRGGPTGRRGNPSFLRWTGVRAAVPRAWPPPTKFRTEIWGVGQVVGPYGRSAEALGIRPYGCSAGGAQQRRVGRVSGISWTPPPPVRRSGCCRGSRRGP